MTDVQKKDDTYDAWVERVAAERKVKPLTAGDVIEPGKPQSYTSVEFLRLEREHYIGEVGKRGDDYIFHFFPKAHTDSTFASDTRFEEKMGDVFLSVFKNPNQIQAAWTEEVSSWAVKVTGFVNTVWGDDQALSIFDKLDKALASK